MVKTITIKIFQWWLFVRLDDGFTNIFKVFIILALLLFKANYNDDSCNDNDDEFKWFDKYFHLGRFPPADHLPSVKISVLVNLALFQPPATSKACLKHRRKRIGQLVDIFTCSPLLVRKLVQPCWYLGVARSGRESRYLPSESYLGQKEDDDDGNDDLNTCPPSHDSHCYQNPQLWGSRCWMEQRTFPSRYFEEWTSSHLQ